MTHPFVVALLREYAAGASALERLVDSMEQTLAQYCDEAPAQAAIRQGYAIATAPLVAKMEELMQRVGDAVLHHRASVEADEWRARYIPGVVTWDDAALLDYAQTHPEILAYRHEDHPTVCLEKIGEEHV